MTYAIVGLAYLPTLALCLSLFALGAFAGFYLMGVTNGR